MDEFNEFTDDFEKSKFVVIPVPFDKMTTYRKGAAAAPQKIIEAFSQVELFDIDTKKPVNFAKGLFVEKEINAETVEDLVGKVKFRVTSLMGRKIPIILGGDHTVSIGAFNALPRDVLIVSIDAHGDLRDSYEGSMLNHACVMRRALDSHDIIELGVRAICDEEWQLIKQRKLPIFFAEELKKNFAKSLSQLKKLVKGKKVYLTVDIDGFDPAVAPGTGTPVPGGLDWYQVRDICKTICENSRIIGFDVVEVLPQSDTAVTEFLAAQLVYKIMNYIG